MPDPAGNIYSSLNHLDNPIEPGHPILEPVKTIDFDYELPEALIAQTPIEPRDSARLMILNRKEGSITHTVFRDIGQFLRPGDLLVLNQTRVLKARLLARKIPSGGRIEILLLRDLGEQLWETLVSGRRLLPGVRFQVDDGLEGEIIEALDRSRRVVRFSGPVGVWLDRIGLVPLPPYIKTQLEDAERYQTVFARDPGSVAAPTAGLHFTPDLLDNLRRQGVGITFITLHVGLDTFAPVTEARPAGHQIHSEWYQVNETSARAINQARRSGGRIIAVGTTCVRAMESAVIHPTQPGELVGPSEGLTGLFILPGYQFQVVDSMITNFHLPRTTLLMLVSAFAGREQILAAYEMAKQSGYRFYSFGDAMLIL